MMQTYDVIIIGAGAAGLMCAIETGKRGRRVAVLDHSVKIAEKIRISGGGRCNFTNLYCAPDRYISNNPKFCHSALRRYSQHDFIAMVEPHGIHYHEKTLGQLFCDNSANDIIEMLLAESRQVNAVIQAGISIEKIEYDGAFYHCTTSKGPMRCQSLVIACGGLSIPKIGATPFGYRIAEQFGHNIIPPRAGLVPLTFDPAILSKTKEMSGISIDPARVYSQSKKFFEEAILFTHRGISGPAILQISSYWKTGEDIIVNMLPHIDVTEWLKQQRQTHGRRALLTTLETLLPHKLAQHIIDHAGAVGRTGDLSDKTIRAITEHVQKWRVKPSGSEGYRTAEVTLGGVDTDELSSKTFESKRRPGLYFIGEVVDVTGHLGGFNFQWAWSSGWCAGQYA